MMRSLYSGVSGLRTHQTKMDVIGNNIANVNTVAFKSTAVTFNDIMYQTTSGASGATENTGGVNAKQIGLGVATGSTKISITSAGASESTSNAFDIKLTDSNSTNFFIVNNGSETLFTRAGSFYLDGSGNLAMTSTGYLVQGWQVDTTTGQAVIRRDTVSPLRILKPENMTSAPEATTRATVSGLIDKNDSNVTGDAGYAMNLTFYDNLGYSYNAKFAVKAVDTQKGTYSVELTNIYDDKETDILAEYVGDDGDKKANIFGEKGTGTKTFAPTKSGQTLVPDSQSFKVSSDGTLVTVGTKTYSFNNAEYVAASGSDPAKVILKTDATGTAVAAGEEVEIKVAQLYGIDPTNSTFTQNYPGATLELDSTNPSNLKVTYDTVNYTLQYNPADGTFFYIGAEGQEAVDMNLSAFTDYPSFENININFSKVLNMDNGGTSTMGIEKGDVDEPAIGYGKKLGALTGVSVDKSGQIFGSY
nr:flagellar hook-basal body complex protein [Lachnospiraceae bacterium]